MSASAALTGRAELLDERVRVAEERFQQLVADAEQRLNEMAEQYGAALQLNGKQSIDLYATNRRVEALEAEIARLRASGPELMVSTSTSCKPGSARWVIASGCGCSKPTKSHCRSRLLPWRTVAASDPRKEGSRGC